MNQNKIHSRSFLKRLQDENKHVGTTNKVRQYNFIYGLPDKEKEPNQITSGGPKCPHCPSKVFRYSWQQFINNTWHIRAECQRCHRFARYAKQNPKLVKDLGGKPK